MTDILSVLSVGIGIIVNIIFFEVFGLAAGGMVVPGYIALNIHHPVNVISTIFVSLCVFWILRFISNFMLVYGRRHLILSILLGFILGQIINIIFTTKIFLLPADTEIIGYIVPGLIAYWMERQGVIRTITAMLIGSIIARFFLIIVMGGKLPL